MINNPDSAQEPTPPRKPEVYEDPHYHDEDEIVPTDDTPPSTVRLPAGAKSRPQVPPPRRRFYDD